jgi:hypothetical protein
VTDRELGSPVLPCQRRSATLVVEIARRDEEPLSAPATVRLHGVAERADVTRGEPARVTFTELDPGAYRVEVTLSGEEVAFAVTTHAHEAIALAASASTAVRVEVEGDDWELVQAALSCSEDLVDDGDGGDDDGDEDEEDAWEVVAAELHDAPDEVTEDP